MHINHKIKRILFKYPKYYSLVVFVIGIICTSYIYQTALIKERNETYNNLQQRAEIYAKDIEAEFKRSFFQVSSVANLFSSSTWVSYSEFTEFVSRVFDNFPEGRRITSVHRFPLEKASDFIEKIKNNSEPQYKNFAIFDFLAPDVVSAATPIDNHYSVTGYTFPELRDKSFIGRNIKPNSPIGPSIYSVIKDKSPLISNFEESITGIQNEPFILYIFPVFAKKTFNIATSEVKGLIVSSQYISSFFINNTNVSDNFDYILKDSHNNLYQYPNKKLISPEYINPKDIQFTFPIQLINNHFDLIITPTDQHLTNPDSLLFELFIAGILLTLTISFIIHSLLSIHNNLTKEVSRQTSELVGQKNQLNINNQQLAIAVKEAKASESAKAEFLANMSHEIRTPLNGIIGLTGLLKQTKLNKLQLEYLDKLTFSGKHLLSVINDILDFSKIESGHIVLEKKVFSIYSVIDNLRVSFDEQAKSKGLIFTVSIEDHFFPDLIGDVFRINQILINLCGNAIKFTEAGRVDVAISMIKNNHFDQRPNVYFKISDTGLGMEECEINNLFNKFSQADTSTTRKFGGTGLGLSISQKLCQAMDGDINVVSSKKNGSSFTARILLELNKDVLIENSKHRVIEGSIDILVVDDNPIALKIISSFLNNMGVRPIAVQTAKEGLKALQNRQFNIKVIISDWSMPVMDGASFLKEVAKLALPAAPKVIIISAYEPSIIENAKAFLPIESVLSKPCHTDVLFNAIEKCLQNPNAPSENAQLKNRLFNICILVVEDNEINQVVIEHLLVDEGAIVTVVNNGQEAIDLINQNNNFQLILMDIQMPIMDGIQATKIIRSHKDLKISEIPIVALSANVLEKEVASYLAIGMNAHGAKPVNIENLLKTILPLLS